MVKKFLYGIAIVLFSVLAYHAYDLYAFKKEGARKVQEKGAATMAYLKGEIDSLLIEITGEAERLAKDFGANEYTPPEIERIIKESALGIPELQGVTACYEPYALSAEERLYCPFYNKGRGTHIYVGQGYDYTDKNVEGTAWYRDARDKGATWAEPYYGANAEEWLIEYGVPFYYGSGPRKGQVRGTITMSIEARDFKKLILSMSLGKTGYGIIVSEKGNFLSHPINSYIGSTNLKTVQGQESQKEMVEAYGAMLKAQSGNVSFKSPKNDKETLFYYDTIATSNWGIGLIFNRKELLANAVNINHRYIKLGLLLSGLILVLIAIYFNKDYLDEGEIWQLSVLASTFLILNIMFVWYLEHTSAKDMDIKSAPIADMGGLDDFINQRNMRSDSLRMAKFTPIPTGIFIDRMAFVNSYNLNVSGTIWQKYPVNMVDSVQVGFRLPQTSPFAEASLIEERERTVFKGMKAKDNYMLVGWDFRVTLQQYLDYKNFPFDKRHLSIDIVPIDNEDRLLFTPDLAGYEFTTPSRKPGLNQSIKISGNRILKSYFNYTVESFDTDFGMESKALFEDVPILHYNLNLRRVLFNVFVTYLIPIFVTLIMMFILIVACAKTEERQGIIEAMAAFFFVLIFSHIDMRKEIITAELIFIEYFYFIAYFMIILSSWNLITYAKSKSKLFDFNENQIFKASYFPFFFLCILVLTLLKFY